MSGLRIAIMSDIHADEIDNDDTRIFVENGHPRVGQYPMSDLEVLIDELALEADYLLLPGDTANKANAVGLQFGWRRSHAVAAKLRAQLIATSGNHDVVTRKPVADPSFLLRNLLPGFPTGDRTIDDLYWDKGWTVVERPDHRFLVMDSTAGFPPFPTSGSAEDEKSYLLEIERGALRDGAEADIEAYIAKAPRKLNIALLHHHPVEHQLREHLKDGYGPMRRGSELIDILASKPNSGRWLVVHGHKHIPQLVAATSVSASGPIVLCAGSLGGRIWEPVNTVARNQFHIVDVENEHPDLGFAGTVESYTWGVGFGWYLSERRGSGLPGRAGFGSTLSPDLLVTKIDRALPPGTGSFLSSSEVKRSVPEIPYLLPQDSFALEDLASLSGIIFARTHDGQIQSIARK